MEVRSMLLPGENVSQISYVFHNLDLSESELSGVLPNSVFNQDSDTTPHLRTISVWCC